MPTFNWEVSIGSIVTIVTVAGFFASFYYGTGNSLKQLGTVVSEMKEDLKVLNKVITDIALSNQRQDNFEKRTDDRFKMIQDDLREMKHGKGFIKADG